MGESAHFSESHFFKCLLFVPVLSGSLSTIFHDTKSNALSEKIMKPSTGLRISRGLTLRFRHVPYKRAFNSGGVSFPSVPPVQQLTNSLTREKEDLKMVNSPVLRWYSCGPTVYDTAHLGHAYSYMQFDLIRRVLENFRGINVVQVMNVTDIDDKIIAKANQVGFTMGKHQRAV